MSTDIAHHLVLAATELRHTHPEASALQLLDLLFVGEGAERRLFLPSAMLDPRAPLGQLMAQAFDSGMTPKEWHDWTGPDADPSLPAVLMPIWRAEVLAQFEARYHVTIE